MARRRKPKIYGVYIDGDEHLVSPSKEVCEQEKARLVALGKKKVRVKLCTTGTAELSRLLNFGE